MCISFILSPQLSWEQKLKNLQKIYHFNTKYNLIFTSEDLLIQTGCTP